MFITRCVGTTMFCGLPDLLMFWLYLVVCLGLVRLGCLFVLFWDVGFDFVDFFAYCVGLRWICWLVCLVSWR